MQLLKEKLNIIIGAGFLITLLSCWNLWIPAGYNNRQVPNIALSFLRYNPGILSFCLWVLLLLAIGADIIGTRFLNGRIAISNKIILLLSLLALICLDVIRLQPWVFLFALFYLAMILCNNTADLFKAVRYILVGMYMWAGLHKLQPDFIDQVILPLIKLYGIDQRYSVLGYGIAAIEIFIAISLLWSGTRKFSTSVAIGFHCCVIIQYGILHQYNLVIIPWNLTCAGVCYLIGKSTPTPFTIKNKRILFVNWILIGFAGVLPMLHLFGNYPAALSWNLYSGKDKPFLMAAEGQVVPMLFSSSITTFHKENVPIININHWILQQLNVPVNTCDCFIVKKIDSYLKNHYGFQSMM